MRTPHDMMIDRTLLMYALRVIQDRAWPMAGDVKVHQLVFLAELHMLGKGVRGLHYDFVRFPYGAFSRELDNDLLALRRKELVRNFDVAEGAEGCLRFLSGEAAAGGETNEQVMTILHSVVETYGPQDVGAMTKSVEDVEISAANRPEDTVRVLDVPFHTVMLVPSRIDVAGDFSVSPRAVPGLKAALGL